MIDGLTIPSLSADKREKFAGACWATVIGHHHAILLLARAGHYGSARALIRPLLEAHVHGVWLKMAATDREVDGAGQDRFPTFARMIDAIEDSGRVPGDRLTELKAAWWGRTCTLSPAGVQHISARLTPEGVGNSHDPEDMFDALAWADWTAIQAVRGFGMMAGNVELVRAADEQIRDVLRKDALPS